MDLGLLFGGPAPAGPQPGAVSAGPAAGAAAPGAPGADGFASLVDLALEQLAGDGERPTAVPGSETASRPDPARDDEDAPEAFSEAADVQVDAMALSVLIALASQPVVSPPVASPVWTAVVPPPVAGEANAAAGVTAAAADPPVTTVAAAEVPVPVAPPAASSDASFQAALDAIAAEGPTTLNESVEAPPAGDGAAPDPQAVATPAAPAPARGAAARPGAKPATPAIAAVASALAPGASAASTAPAADRPAQAQGTSAAPAPGAILPAAPDATARTDAPGRGAAPAASPAAVDVRPAGAHGAAFGEASADASTGERFAPPASAGRPASVAGRGLDVAVAGEPGPAAAPMDAAVAATAVPVPPGVQALRALDAPLPAARFEQTLAAVDPETRNLQAMVRTVRLFTAGDGTGEARLQLEPDHLGPVALTVRVEQGSVSAHFRAETPAAQRWIETHQQELRAGLREQGLEVKELVVTTDPDGRRDRQQDPQPRRPRARRAHADAPRFEVHV